MSIYITEPQGQVHACIIWMHGLGADAGDMMSLSEQLKIDFGLRQIFLDAPLRAVTLNNGMIMRAWYDILGMEFSDREDQQGIEQSRILIQQVIEEQRSSGLALERIFLAGFSQGGAMALHTALHTPGPLGGVIALSSYLPLVDQTEAVLDRQTPFFMAMGLFDPLVLPLWTQKSKSWLEGKGYEQISFHQYPMEHSICLEELNDLSFWLNERIEGDSHDYS